ncbi:MAG: hypothetical protein GXO65_02070 [Euryarchaeota archaeon]|nr:hypothetical protein [Euryarchaeota archaeon]
MVHIIKAFLVPAGIAFSMVLAIPHLPRPLYHRWFFGIYSILVVYIFMVIPYLWIGEYKVAVASMFLSTLGFLLIGKDLVRMAMADLRSHFEDGRSPFEHSHA